MTLVLVSGAIANKYRNGGAAWTRLSWTLGFKRLGFQVHFLEQLDPGSCVDASGAITNFEDSLNLQYFQQVVEQFSLTDSAALVYGDGEKTWGMSYGEVLDLADGADLLVNISGHLRIAPLIHRLRRKVYIDLDPGFTQFWAASGNPGLNLSGHDWHFTIGENIGTPGCPIPTGGYRWRPTRQPVVLDLWPVAHDACRGRFTTVASWRGPYGRVEYGGKTFGLKVHEFRKFVQMPRKAPGVFEIALDIHPADRRDLRWLRRHGWQIVNPEVVVPDPVAFRGYVQGSSAEFSVAQGIYVETQSGWVSDRTVRYLASGRPALVQDTGFSRNYQVGHGLVPFRTLKGAVSGAAEIMRDYESQCRAARALAEELFDSDKVLGRLIEEVGVTP